MVKIDALIFGYRKIKIKPEDLSLITSYLIKASIPSAINSDGSITVRERDFKKTKDLLQGRIEFSYSIPKGAYGFLLNLPHRWTLLISLVLTTILVLLLSSLVWDIRIDGNERLSDDEVIKTLADCGFEVGDLWGRVDLGKIENEVLIQNGNISWININRRGTVAYIRLMERESGDNKDQQTPPQYANIVATTDCVIEEMTVRRGTPTVKVGDVVKKGDILVAGVLSPESGGGFCAADATVIGRVSDRVSVKIDRIEEKKTYEDPKLYSFSVKIFKISLNLFKKYGNLTKECDIIENEIAYSLLGRYKLPFSVSKVYSVESTKYTVEHTDEELVHMAQERLNALTVERLDLADLLRIRTDGGFTDDGYTMTSQMVFLTDVGKVSEFEIE